MELILVVVISAGMAENSQNGVSRSLKGIALELAQQQLQPCEESRTLK